MPSISAYSPTACEAENPFTKETIRHRCWHTEASEPVKAQSRPDGKPIPEAAVAGLTPDYVDVLMRVFLGATDDEAHSVYRPVLEKPDTEVLLFEVPARLVSHLASCASESLTDLSNDWTRGCNQGRDTTLLHRPNADWARATLTTLAAMSRLASLEHRLVVVEVSP